MNKKMNKLVVFSISLERGELESMKVVIKLFSYSLPLIFVKKKR